MSANDEALIRGLIQQAEKAAAAGQRDDSQRLLARAAGLAPEHPLVLNARAIDLLQSGNAAGARDLLKRAAAREPGNPSLSMNLATALRALDLRDEEEMALQAVLAIEPRHLLALLQKAELLERRGKPKAAAKAYQNALQTISPGMRLPAALKNLIARALDVVRRNDAALAAHIGASAKAVRAQHSAAELDRAEHGLAAFLGTRRIYHSQPTFLHVPKLAALEFFPRTDFPWLDEFEAATPGDPRGMRAGIARRRRRSGAVHRLPGRPSARSMGGAQQVAERWSAFFLWRDGEAHR